jgi:hypothetical protein
MKYGVRNLNDGTIAESTKTDNFETARYTAVALSDWNIPCDVVDLENNDLNGDPVVLKHLSPYKDLFGKMPKPFLPIRDEVDPIRKLGSRGGVPFSPDH